MNTERSKSALRLSRSHAFISSDFNDGFKDSLSLFYFLFFSGLLSSGLS